MATATLTTTPTTLDPGTAGTISIRNTGSNRVTIINGGQRTTLNGGLTYDTAVQGAVTVHVTAQDSGTGTIRWEVGGTRLDTVTYDELTTAAASAAASAVATQHTADISTFVPSIVLTGSGIDPTGATSSLAAMNALLASAQTFGVRHVRGVPGASYLLDGWLDVRSDTALDMTGATVTLAAGTNNNMVRNHADASAREFSNLVTTSGSATITSAAGTGAAAFVAGDVGKPITIYYAGTNGVRLDTTITAVGSATSATIATNALASITNGCGQIGARDKNITIQGGTWIRAAGNGGDGGAGDRVDHCFVLRYVDNLIIRDMEHRSYDGKYNISIGGVSDYLVDNVWYNPAATAGVQMAGQCFRGMIRRQSGYAGDDLVAVTTNDTANGFPNILNTTGPVEDLVFEDINLYAKTNPAAAGHAVGVYGCAEGKYPTRNITVRRARAMADSLFHTVCLQNMLENVTVDRCVGRIIVRNAATVTGTLTQRGIRIRDHFLNAVTGQVTQAVLCNNSYGVVAIDDLTISGFSGSAPASGSWGLVTVGPGTTVSTLRVSDAWMKGASSQVVYVYGSGTTVTNMMLDRVRQNGVDFSSGGLVKVDTSAAITRLYIDQTVCENTDCPLVIGQPGTVFINSSGFRFNGINSARFSTVAATWYGAGTEATLSTTLSSGASLALRGDLAPTGTATLVGGTVTVNDAKITANSVIRLAGKTAGGTPGAVYVSARVASTSFTITSTSATDTSVIQYYIDAY